MKTFEPFTPFAPQEPFKPTLREVLTRYSRLDDLLRECLPIVERHALGPSGSDKRVWELLDSIKREVNG